MWSTCRVNMDRRSQSGQGPGGAGMIQMDMGQQDMIDIVRSQPMFSQTGDQMGPAGVWSRFDEGPTGSQVDQKGTDDFGDSLKVKVDGVNVHGEAV